MMANKKRSTKQLTLINVALVVGLLAWFLVERGELFSSKRPPGIINNREEISSADTSSKTTFPGQLFRGRVDHVPDGDSMTVLQEGRPVTIRLFGVDAPELGQDYGSLARDKARALAAGKTVTVRIRDVDQYNRQVAEVELEDGRILNREMLRSGLAWWYRNYAPDDRDLRELEAAARKAGLGLWKDKNPVPPWEWRRWPFCASKKSSVYHPCSCPTLKGPDRISPVNQIRFPTEEQAIRSGRKHCKCNN